jgi:hypothetical protein
MSNHLKFIATAVSTDQDDDYLIATLDSEAAEYVMLQRFPDFGSDDDAGIYVEINDQINSGYAVIESCTISGTNFHLSFSTQIGGYTRVDVALAIPPNQRLAFTAMLHRIFTGYSSLLTIAPPQKPLSPRPQHFRRRQLQTRKRGRNNHIITLESRKNISPIGQSPNP